MYDKNSKSFGRLTYAPSSRSAEDLTNELATLMTAGRLSAESRQTIQQIIETEDDPDLAVVMAQSLIATSPEFHSTNIVRRTETPRPISTPPQRSTQGYKAVVYVLLAGGVDSYNMLVPHTCTSTNNNGQTLREQYDAERTTVAFSDDERTRIINATKQPCVEFAIHPKLEIVEKLYKEGDLAFFANAGVLNVPVTKGNYYKVTKTSLFDHYSMRKEAQKVDPFDKALGSGVLGRMCDQLATNGFDAKPMTVEDITIATAGLPGKAIPPVSVPAMGINKFNPKPKSEKFDHQQIMIELNGESQLQSSIYGETWSNGFVQALHDSNKFREDLSKVDLTQSWKGNDYTLRLKTAATLISSHNYRGTDREVIFVELGGWDNHQVSVGLVTSLLFLR
jgi:uncharacterized protein (DUF1501 family)